MEQLDRIFDVLSEERRRYALYYLEQEDEPVPVEELVEQVTAWETEGSADVIPNDELQNIELMFYHADLPVATDLEYIQYDSEAGEIELTGIPPKVDAILKIARVVERPGRNS